METTFQTEAIGFEDLEKPRKFELVVPEGSARPRSLSFPQFLDDRGHFDNHRNMEIQSQSERSLDNMAAVFAAMGQPSRLKIVRLLLSAHPQGLPAGEIRQELDILASTLSHHLDKLRQVGIVTAAKERQWIWYSVQADSRQFDGVALAIASESLLTDY